MNIAYDKQNNPHLSKYKKQIYDKTSQNQSDACAMPKPNIINNSINI